MPILLLFALPLIMGQSGGCGSDGNSSPTQEEQDLKQVLSDSLKEMDIAGGTVAVGHPDGDLVTVSAGIAQDENLSSKAHIWPIKSFASFFSATPALASTSWSGTPKKNDMHQRIGSITKTFTSALILLLQEDGLLSLDQTVEDWFGPNYYPRDNPVTLSNLLHMTSGYKSFTELEKYGTLYFEDPCQTLYPEDMIKMANASQERIVFAPGTDWQYCNTNFVILGLIAEAATGLPYQKLIQDRILTPLGLQDTSSPDLTDSGLPDPYTHGYLYINSNWKDVSAWSPSSAFSAGNMISTASDLVKWIRALLDGDLLSENSKEKLLDFVSQNDGGKWDGSEPGYGLGLFYEKGAKGHDGSIPGYEACCYKYKDHYFAVQVNVTLSNSSVNDIFWKVAMLYYPEAGL